MNAIRSVIFNVFYIFGSFFWAFVLLWTFFFPPKKCTAIISAVYGKYLMLIVRYIMGIRLDIKGMENLPKDGPYIIAAKHQSALETLKIPFSKEFNYPVIVLKKELTRLPLWGLYPKFMGLVTVDRSLGMESLRAMTEGCKGALRDGRSIAIFPQGTRVKPGATVPYKAGLAKLYKDLGVPIVPMALNTGVLWGRNAFFKKAGTATLEFLPALPAGLPPLKMMEQLEKIIEQESDRLVIAAGGPALKKEETAV